MDNTTETKNKCEAFDTVAGMLGRAHRELQAELWTMHGALGEVRYDTESAQHADFALMGEIAQAVESLRAVKATVAKIAHAYRCAEGS